MRREVPEISWGDFAVLRASRNDVLALRYDWRNNSVLCLHNFSAGACTVKFKSGAANPGEDVLVNLLPTIIVKWPPTAAIASFSSLMGIAGIAWVGSTTCSSAAKCNVRGVIVLLCARAPELLRGLGDV